MNTFTIFLPLLLLTNGFFVPLSAAVNTEITGYFISPQAFRNYWVSIGLMYITMPIGICAANRLRKRTAAGIDTFLTTPRNPANAQLYIALVMLLCVVSICQIYADRIQLNLMSYFTGFASYADYAAHRYSFAEATRGLPYYLYNRLPYAIAPLAYVMIWNWGGWSRLRRLILIALVVFAVVQTGHKMPLVVIAGTLMLSRHAIRYRSRLTRGFLLLLAGLGLGLVMVVLPLLYLAQGLTDYPSALFWSVERIVAEPHRALQLYFEVFPRFHPHLHGLSSRTVSALVGNPNYIDSSQYIPIDFLGLENTSFPALFIGEAWADFGYIGVVAYSVIVGFVLQAYNVWYFNGSVHYLEDTALILCIIVGSVHLLASTVLAGFVTYGLGSSILLYAVVRGTRLTSRVPPEPRAGRQESIAHTVSR